MTPKPVFLRERGRKDIDEGIDFYLAEAGEAVALRFIDALQVTLGAVGRQPRARSPRYGEELDLPGLRSRNLKRFPHVVFYLEHDHSVDVWRVLHAKRDIPARLQDT